MTENDDVYARLDASLLDNEQFEALGQRLRQPSRVSPSVMAVLENSAEYARVRQATQQADLNAEIDKYKSDKANNAATIADLSKKLAERGGTV